MSIFNVAPRGQHKQERFEAQQMAIDRRLLVNRKERKQMFRVWMQAKFLKTASS